MKKNHVLLSLCLILSYTNFTLGNNLLTNKQQLSETLVQGFGTLLKVEDAGYPIFVLTIEHQKGINKLYNINVESVKNVDAAALNSWIGKKVSLNYTTKVENVIMRLKAGNKSIIDQGEYHATEGTKKITGILRAKAVTKGDLPDMMYITTSAKITLEFPYFITEDIVKCNGKKVTGLYEENSVNTVQSIRLVSQSNTKAESTIPFTVANHYFVKNTYLSTTQGMSMGEPDFNMIFGPANTPTIIDFKTHFVIAAILDNTANATTMTAKSLKLSEGKLTFTYEVKTGAAMTYTIRPCLIIVVDRKYAQYGKDIKVVKIETKQ